MPNQIRPLAICLFRKIVMVFDGKLSDERIYTQETIEGREFDGFRQAPLKAVWKRISEFGMSAPLYPDGLLERLK